MVCQLLNETSASSEIALAKVSASPDRFLRFAGFQVTRTLVFASFFVSPGLEVDFFLSLTSDFARSRRATKVNTVSTTIR